MYRSVLVGGLGPKN